MFRQRDLVHRRANSSASWTQNQAINQNSKTRVVKKLSRTLTSSDCWGYGRSLGIHFGQPPRIRPATNCRRSRGPLQLRKRQFPAQASVRKVTSSAAPGDGRARPRSLAYSQALPGGPTPRHPLARWVISPGTASRSSVYSSLAENNLIFSVLDRAILSRRGVSPYGRRTTTD